MGFSTPSYSLNDLFDRIERGDLQIPDFQREYLWNVDSIRALILTVLRGYPLGCLMALDTRGRTMQFKARPVDGAPDRQIEPGMLLLDGQQRLTSLYNAFREDGVVRCVDARGTVVNRRFYVDMRRAVGHTVVPDEAVFAVNEHGEIRSYFAPAELNEECIPVSDLLDSTVANRLFDLADGAEEGLLAALKEFFSQVVRPLGAYEIPVIRISRATAAAGIGSIFASANRAGMPMDVMDLLTAVYAKEDPSFVLRDDWEETRRFIADYPALRGLTPTDYLTAVTLLATARQGKAKGNREHILRLSLEEYKEGAAAIRVTLREAGEYLARKSIIREEDLPYTAQVISLAVIIALLAENPQILHQASAWEKLDRWYWSGIFGELYGTADVRNRMAHDIDDVVAWVRDADAPEPATVREAHLDPTRLVTADPHSGFFRGVIALLMAEGAREWRTGLPFDRSTWAELQPVNGYIFSREFCEANEVDPVFAQSVLNRTPVSLRIAYIMDAYGPVRYLNRIQEKSLMDDAEFDEVLATHCLNPEVLHRGDFVEFFLQRQALLAKFITQALSPAA